MAKKTRSFVASDSTIHLLHRAGQLVDEAFLTALGRDGITARQFIVLSIVAREDNPSQTTICELSGIDRSTLADIVRRLVSRGLLARKRTREDARRYAVRITDAGQKALDVALGVARDVDDTVLGVLPSALRQDFENALRLMVEKLQVKVAE
ncbi:MAG: MarR family transcriptional regulator [Hyphomicrobium sp.]